MLQLTDFLPTTRKEIELRGWTEVDIILFSGDAYVDHPSFGAAVIGRTLEAAGFRVAIVPQPDWHGDYRDFKKLGRPRLFFGIAPGCMDSMVNKYTANRRLRSEDAYSPDGRHDMRPEYPTIVYSKILKELFPDVPVVLGGIEASLRRITHYDYWQDELKKCILCDAGADLLIYGMGEKPIVEVAKRLAEIKNLELSTADDRAMCKNQYSTIILLANEFKSTKCFAKTHFGIPKVFMTDFKMCNCISNSLFLLVSEINIFLGLFYNRRAIDDFLLIFYCCNCIDCSFKIHFVPFLGISML